MTSKMTMRLLRRRILSLKEEIDNLQQQLDDRDEEKQYDERRAQEEIWAIKQAVNLEHQGLQNDIRREREEAENRSYERNRIVRDLKSAVDWKKVTGRDPFGDIERCVEKLRRL